MNLSVLQLNINADNFWDVLIPFLTTHDFDVLQLQELCSKDTINGNINCKRDCFADLQHVLGEKYNGEIVITEHFTSSPTASIGNAIFYKKDFSLVTKKAIPLQQSTEPFPSEEMDFSGVGRGLLHLILEKQNKQISFLTTHFGWAQDATEHPHQTKQGTILFDYLRNVSHPFIFSGDMNLSPDQPTINNITTLARNLVVENHVANTLNPRTHRAKQLFPKGLVVDYLLVSPDIAVKEFSLIEEDISDHFGLSAEIVI